MALHIAQGLVTLIFIFPRLSPARRQRFIRSWDGKVLKIFAMRTQVDAPPGFDLTRPQRLYIGNHISWIDVYALQSITGARFVAKSELAAWPVLGTLIAKSGTIFIERAKRADTRRIVKTVQQHLEDGEIIAVFPEGSTTDGRLQQIAVKFVYVAAIGGRAFRKHCDYFAVFEMLLHGFDNTPRIGTLGAFNENCEIGRAHV